MTGYRVTYPRVVRSEWTKLCALRSTWVVLAVVALLPAVLAAAIGARTHRATLGDAFFGVDVSSLLLGVFGILTITGEYGSGLIRATFAAVPRRVPVLTAKALVLAGLSLPVLLAASTAAFWLNRSFAGGSPAAEPGALRVTIGAAAAPVVLALLGLAMGSLVRHTAAAITLNVLTMLVLPAVLQAVLPRGPADDVVRYVPVAAAQALYAADNPFRMLSPGSAVLVLAGWLALLLTAGATVLRRRDP
jgi:hypothetical protein